MGPVCPSTMLARTSETPARGRDHTTQTIYKHSAIRERVPRSGRPPPVDPAGRVRRCVGARLKLFPRGFFPAAAGTLILDANIPYNRGAG